MIDSTKIRLVSIAFLTLASVGCATGLGPLDKEIGKYGYTLYRPPRTNRGPGWTFQMVRTFGGKTIPSTVCETLYSGTKTIDGSLSLPTIEKSTTVSIDVALDLLEGLIQDLAKAKANLKAVREVTINWGEVSDKELSPEFKFTDTGDRRPIHPRCAAVLRDMKQRGEFKDNIFVVQQAVLARNLRYEFKAGLEASAELAGKYQDLLGLKAGVRVATTGKTSLEFREPRFIGFAAVALIELLPTGELAAAQMATVSGRRVNLDEWERIIGR